MSKLLKDVYVPLWILLFVLTYHGGDLRLIGFTDASIVILKFFSQSSYENYEIGQIRSSDKSRIYWNKKMTYKYIFIINVVLRKFG